MNGKKDKFVVMDKTAWGFYNNPLVLDGSRPHNWLPLSKLAELVIAVGRPLVQADLEVLIGKDGTKARCVICGKDFQPVRFAIIDDEALKLASEKKVIREDMFCYGGSFMEHEKRIYPLCGMLWFYDPTRDDGNGGEWFDLNPQTCLGQKVDEFGQDQKMGLLKPTLTLAGVENIRKQEDLKNKPPSSIEYGTVVELVSDYGGVVKFVENGEVKGRGFCVIYLGTRRHISFNQRGVHFTEKVKGIHPHGISRGMQVVYERSRTGNTDEAFGWASAEDFGKVSTKYQEAFPKSEQKSRAQAAA
jgi:hypothetical protein